MSDKLIAIDSIDSLHKEMCLGDPKHSFVSLIHHDDENYRRNSVDNRYILNLYSIILKSPGSPITGYDSKDVDSGCAIFLSPGQIIASDHDASGNRCVGWTLVVHPNFLSKYQLGRKIEQYTFFSYEFVEALNLSLAEKVTLTQLATNIEQEVNLGKDTCSEYLITSTIELLLDYCHRYYTRKFDNRTVINMGVTWKFYKALESYYEVGKQLESGVPDVSYFGRVLHLSPHYLSDLLKKETGKTASDHISQYVVEQAKTKLLNTSDPINQIAFNLGFNYHQHFSKMFRRKTGLSPMAYRQSH